MREQKYRQSANMMHEGLIDLSRLRYIGIFVFSVSAMVQLLIRRQNAFDIVVFNFVSIFPEILKITKNFNDPSTLNPRVRNCRYQTTSGRIRQHKRWLTMIFFNYEEITEIRGQLNTYTDCLLIVVFLKRSIENQIMRFGVISAGHS